MKILALSFICFLLISISATAQTDSLLSQKYSGDDIHLLAPGLLSTSMGEFSPFFDFNSNELYFMRRTPGIFDYTIYQSKLTEEGWTTPEIASFSGKFRDAAPYLSPDGTTLFYDSKRPSFGLAAESINIWSTMRTGNGWAEPQLIRTPSLNSSSEPVPGRDEFGPAVDAEGNLYFYSFRQPNRGGHFYVSSAPDFQDVQLNSDLPDPSAPTFVSYLYLTPEGNFALLEGRTQGRRDTDIFCSRKLTNGTWTKAVNIQSINSTAGDGTPSMSADGKFVFFASDRKTTQSAASNPNLYMVSTKKILDECFE